MTSDTTHQADSFPDELIMAAIDRAERHRGRGRIGIPVWEITEHLCIGRRSAAARHVRSRLAALERGGCLERSRRRGVVVWALTAAGRRRLQRAFAVGNVDALPESPQHRAWRKDRLLASQEIDRMRASVRAAAADIGRLLDAHPAASSDAWFALSERTRTVLRHLGSASYCPHEWAEPFDERADIDDHFDPGDVQLAEAERVALRARRAGRRNTKLWRERESC